MQEPSEAQVPSVYGHHLESAGKRLKRDQQRDIDLVSLDSELFQFRLDCFGPHAVA